MKWHDYAIVPPEKSGNYLIYIYDHIHVGRFEKKYGFSSVEDDCAFIQEYITHWSELPEPPQ